MVNRLFVEKKKGFDVEAQGLFNDLKENLHLQELTGVRIFNRYDVEGVDEATYQASKFSVFAEQAIDQVFEESLDLLQDDSPEASLRDLNWFGVEYLQGQYDQRADSAAQCIQLISMKEKLWMENLHLNSSILSDSQLI